MVRPFATAGKAEIPRDILQGLFALCTSNFRPCESLLTASSRARCRPRVAVCSQAEEENCPVISPALESLSFLVLSDNGIVSVVGSQFIKCYINISFYPSHIFHQVARFCERIDFHFPELLWAFPPSATN